jgi:hypothetical protein
MQTALCRAWPEMPYAIQRYAGSGPIHAAVPGSLYFTLFTLSGTPAALENITSAAQAMQCRQPIHIREPVVQWAC